MIVNRLELKAAIARLGFFYNGNSVISALDNILFEMSESNKLITMSVTDIENYITEKVNSIAEPSGTTVQKDKQFLINFHWLRKVVSNSYSENISISESSDGLCIISGKNRHFYTPQDDVGNFPKKGVINFVSYSFKADTSKLSLNIKRCINFMSNDYLRPSMTGVFFDKEGDDIIIVATDAHKLISTSSGLDHKPSQAFAPFIMPKKMVSFIVRNYLGKCDFIISQPVGNNAPATMILLNGKTQVRVSLVDANFPEWRNVIPENKGEVVLNVDRRLFKQSLSCAVELSNPSTKEITFSVKDSNVKIKCKNEDFGTDSTFNVEAVSIECRSDERVSFNVNSKFLLQAISVFKNDNVKMQMPLIPTRAVFIDDDILVMPLMNNHPDRSY